jgi:hypothetical protein
LWRAPSRIAQPLSAAAHGLGRRLGPPPAWVAAGGLVGVLPLLGDYLIGGPWPTAPLITAVLATALLVAAVASDSLARGLGALAGVFLAHNALAIALVAHDPTGMARILDGGVAYWGQSRHWILTGINPEYELGQWVPAHLQLLLAMVLFTYSSLGLVTLCQGVAEVDLTNFYVGELIAHSHRPWLAIALGWHPWSVCRGVGYVFLTYELASLSFEHLTGVPTSTRRRRVWRWTAGLSFLLIDGIVKFIFLDTVRCLLAGNLL